MSDSPKIWVYTRAYNAEKTIRRAIESVLGQSYKNIQYTIRDNGSTDNTYKICKEYAERDSRIKLVHNKINNIHGADEDDAFNAEKDIWIGRALIENDYACFLDADDAYDITFFEKAVDLSKKENLDIVMCGVEMIDDENQRGLGVIIKEHDTIIDLSQEENMFPIYHWYMRQIWGKLFRKDIICETLNYLKSVRKAYLLGRTDTGIYYGSDTLYCLSAFAKANRIGILNGIGHYWYIQKKSESTRMKPNRLDSDWILFNETRKYLYNKTGTISAANELYIIYVYEKAISDTIELIQKSEKTSTEKYIDIYTILDRKETKSAFSSVENNWNNIEIICGDNNGTMLKKASAYLKNFLFELLFKYYLFCDKNNYDLSSLVVDYFPHCYIHSNKKCIRLFIENKEIRNLLLKDDVTSLILSISNMIQKNENTKKYDLVDLVKTLTARNGILSKITDRVFIRKYFDIYILTVREEYEKAISKMTDILNTGSNRMSDALIWLYLTLSALLGLTTEFVFGKLKAVEYYMESRQYDKCRETLKELDEMGIEENDEIIKIRNLLDTVIK